MNIVVFNFLLFDTDDSQPGETCSSQRVTEQRQKQVGLWEGRKERLSPKEAIIALDFSSLSLEFVPYDSGVNIDTLLKEMWDLMKGWNFPHRLQQIFTFHEHKIIS